MQSTKKANVGTGYSTDKTKFVPIIESLIKDSGEYRKEKGVLVKDTLKEGIQNVLLVYEKDSRLPSYLVLKGKVDVPPEVIVELNDQKFLLTLLQTPLASARRVVVKEDVPMNGGNARIIPIMTIMKIMHEVGGNKQKAGKINENTEIVLYGTTKKAPAGKIFGSNIRTTIVEKGIEEIAPAGLRGMIPQRLKGGKFNLMLVRGTCTYLFTEGNHLATLVDYVPSLLALKPHRVVVNVDGKEWFGAEISEGKVKEVLETLGVKG